MKLNKEEIMMIMEMSFTKLEGKYQDYQTNPENWSHKDNLINERTYCLILKCVSNLKGISVQHRLEKYESWFNELDKLVGKWEG